MGWAGGGADPDPRARGGAVELAVWQYLIGVSAMMWVLLAGFGLVLLRRLTEDAAVRPVDGDASGRRATVRFVGFVFAVIVVPLLIGAAAGLRNPYVMEGQNWKIPLLHLIAGCANLPVLVALKRIELTAADDRGWGTTPADIARLRLLRRTTRLATAGLGAVIALAVIATGALRQATAAAGLTPLPDTFGVVYGAAFTGVVAGVHLYVSSAVENRARRLLDQVAALPDPSAVSPQEFSAGRSLRGEVAEELELGVDPRADLQSLLAVLSPLIGALLTKVGGL
ncbi:hypothetical protein [Kribbella shirazensis]|uniref:Uncharacterized protein n=1 Tax=Kribbella shirazensis TaxID=1105143 RepID=A0A7X5V7J4_9ACTN|nr:hypothetical protein [Kribbella shirazensis]NIK56083.1 hypothetical protein [Kribbella shirazensis]